MTTGSDTRTAIPALPLQAHVRRAAGATTLLALALGVGLGWCLWRMPMTVHDGLAPIFQAQRAGSVAAVFETGLTQRAYFRPLRVAQVAVVYRFGAGHELLAFKATHIALTLAACLLFAQLLSVRDAADAAAAAVALMVFIGHHAFFILVGEAYPINHFLEIVVLSLLVVVLARGRASIVADAGAVASVLVAVLTLESGLLVWVALVAAYALGWRGVSRRAVAAATLVAVAALVWRFGVLHVGTPQLDERSSGFGLARLDPAELRARFGANPLPFYAYNVVSAALTVIISEPRNGTWIVLREARQGHAQPWMLFHLASSLVLTSLMLAALRRGVPRLWRREGTDADRLVALAAIMVGANAVVGYAYLKDEIVSVAAAFYAAAACPVLAFLIDRAARLAGARWRFAIVTLVLVSGAWTMRAAGTFLGLRSFAFKVGYDWAVARLDRDLPNDAGDPPNVALFERLRAENLRVRAPNPLLTHQARVGRIIEIR